MISRFLAVLVAPAFLHFLAFGQETAGKPTPAIPTARSQQSAPIEIPPAPGPISPSSNCPLLRDSYVPINKTLEARVTTLLDSGLLKPGKNIWVNSLFEGVESDSGCHMLKGAVIYGRVTAASSSKKPAASSLGLQFDRVDCLGRPAEAIKLTLIAIVAPDSSRSDDSVHDSLPGAGGGVGDEWPEGWDQKLDPGGPPNFVHPSEVVGFRKLKLDPHGGPACSALLTSGDRSIELGVGTVLVLAEPEAR